MPDHAVSRPFSPCSNNCLYDERRGCCRGCHRTLPEILRWMTMTDDQRARIWDRIEASIREERQAELDRARRRDGAT